MENLNRLDMDQIDPSELSTLNTLENRLYSVFQPIYSFSNQACVGAEALVRGRSLENGFQVPVYNCLEVPEGLTQAEFSQQLNRMHFENWAKLKRPDNWLFLNLDFEGVTSLGDLCISDLLHDLKMQGHEVVIEVVESEIKDEELFNKVITTLRGLGCLIALDDFGAGHSNVDRIWKAQPDIVKLDRGVLLEATKSLRSQSVLRNLTNLIKQAGSICLLEGVENREQALLAMDIGVDLVQGFYFARPRQLLDRIKQGESCIKEVTEQYPSYIEEKAFLKQIQRKGYETLFESFLGMPNMAALELQMEKLLTLSFVKRFFILDQEGYQVSDEYNVEDKIKQVSVLKKGKGLCWKNRRYFVKAIQAPGRLYVSEPYRSLIDMQLCLTASKVVYINEKPFVACFDVSYVDKSTESVQISV
ncbi:MAG: EAL domain-containing protein [Thiotrichales bacterium]|nr:EAL domain-containing protein [Thiotrichales bacterium]